MIHWGDENGSGFLQPGWFWELGGMFLRIGCLMLGYRI